MTDLELLWFMLGASAGVVVTGLICAVLLDPIKRAVYRTAIRDLEQDRHTKGTPCP